MGGKKSKESTKKTKSKKNDENVTDNDSENDNSDQQVKLKDTVNQSIQNDSKNAKISAKEKKIVNEMQTAREEPSAISRNLTKLNLKDNNVEILKEIPEVNEMKQTSESEIQKEDKEEKTNGETDRADQNRYKTDFGDIEPKKINRLNKKSTKDLEEEGNKLDINKHLVSGFTRFHVNTDVLGVPSYDYNFQKINFIEKNNDKRIQNLKKSRFSWQINDIDDDYF